MKYAVIRLQGHQYKVSEGDEFVVDKLEGKPEAEILLTVNDDKVAVGTPTVAKASITLSVKNDEKGEKIHVRKFKAKSRYRKHIGFRSQLTRLQVEKISA